MLKSFILGVKHFIHATGFLRQNGLLHYYLYPIFVATLYYIGAATAIWKFSSQLTNRLFGNYIHYKIPEINGFLSFLSYLSFEKLIVFIAGILLFLISSRISKYVILIALSPVFSLLSERIDEITNNTTYAFSMGQFLKDILRGSVIAIRNLVLELTVLAFLGLAGIWAGPFSLIIAPILWLVGAYFYGFSMLDYTCERKKMSIREGVLYIRKHRYFVLGNGTMYALFDMLPIIGLIVGPINAVVGATTGIYELEKAK